MDRLAEEKSGGKEIEKISFAADIGRVRLIVTGTVQGVGFRPFIYRIAQEYGLTGWVQNSSCGVIIDAEGSAQNLNLFIDNLLNNPPALARIQQFTSEILPFYGYRNFTIKLSDQGAETKVLVPPDVALCPECRSDILNKTDRHFNYPFTNCTNCGPRFSITRDLPYDRANTAMSAFSMCPDCRQEYDDPLDRRFHAQPVACPNCGPQVVLTDNNKNHIEGYWQDNFRKYINQGAIFAVKGLGGFHLVCDAFNKEAIINLRARKNRPCKPFAVMAKNIEVLKKYCHVNAKEENLISGSAAPIVLLRQNNHVLLPQQLAPGLQSLGVMLPYTPLHMLLFTGNIELLVMTSGNKSDMPICINNDSAYNELSAIADYFLVHNRVIVNRADDSVVRLTGNNLQYIRRSRGYVPEPIQIPFNCSSENQAQPCILGAGGEMKNSFCLLKGSHAFMSQYIGEIDNVEALDNYKYCLANMRKLLDLQPDLAGYDLHPGYLISSFIKKLDFSKSYPIQHHHAHFASCLADNGINKPAIGVILDGTGYGTDGCIWGFELFSGDYINVERHYHLRYTPMPGGDRAVRHNWLMAFSNLKMAFGDEGLTIAARMFKDKNKELTLINQIIDKNINSPLCSSAGRLFDAVSALLGICCESTYEGQAAVELAELILGIDSRHMDIVMSQTYGYYIGRGVIDVSPMIREIVNDVFLKIDIKDIVLKFHNTIAAVILCCVQQICSETGINRVVLSGGVFQNLYLSDVVPKLLTNHGFKVFSHCQVPANDGGLALGQAAIAYWRREKNVFSSAR